MRGKLILMAAVILLSGVCAGAREPGKMEVLWAKPNGDDVIRVATTAAFFDFDRKKDRIVVTCRIPVAKAGGELTLGLPLAGLKVTSLDRDLCVLSGEKIDAQVDCASILKLSAKEPLAIENSQDASFEIRAFDDVLDDRGCMRGVSGNDKKKHLRWYVCVQPAREFDWDSLYNDQMVLMLNADEKNYASDRAIEMARDWYDANILLLWGRIWKGYNEDGKFEPSDPEALKRNIDTAHRLGMKVIAYTQELPGKQPIGAAGFLKGMAKAKTYGLDGLYFDGGARGGWEDNLVMLREARRLYRDGILVMHGNPRALSVYLDYVHYGEHRTSLEEVAQSLSMQEKSRWAIGGIIENAPGMNEEMIDNIIESNSILRCGLMYVYCDDGFLPGAGFTWDDRFLRLYRDYFLPKFRLKGLDYKYKNNLIAKAEFQDKSAKFQKQIQDHLAYKKAMEQSPKVPPGLTPVSTEVSSILDPRYNLWLSTGPQAVDGLISTVWVGGSAMPGTILGRPAGKPEDGVGEWIKLDFGKQVMIANILYDTTYPGYEKQIWQEAFTISGSVDGKNWVVLASKRDLTQPQRFTFRSGAVVRYVQVHNILSHFEGYPNWRLAYVTELQVYPDK